MRALGVAALVRAEHDVVRRGVSERLGVAELWAHLDVTTAALDVLLILGLVLDDQLLAGIAEGVEARGEAEEAGVLGGLHALVLRLVAEPCFVPERDLCARTCTHFMPATETLSNLTRDKGERGLWARATHVIYVALA